MNIANQCPAAGGQAVHRARAMLSIVNDSLEYDDLNSCLQVGIYKITGDSLINGGFEFNLIPNPANNQVLVQLDTNLKGICNVSLYNAFGSNILHHEINCELSEHTIELNSLSSGVYLIEVKVNNYKQIKKLIIIK